MKRSINLRSSSLFLFGCTFLFKTPTCSFAFSLAVANLSYEFCFFRCFIINFRTCCLSLYSNLSLEKSSLSFLSIGEFLLFFLDLSVFSKHIISFFLTWHSSFDFFHPIHLVNEFVLKSINTGQLLSQFLCLLRYLLVH